MNIKDFSRYCFEITSIVLIHRNKTFLIWHSESDYGHFCFLSLIMAIVARKSTIIDISFFNEGSRSVSLS